VEALCKNNVSMTIEAHEHVCKVNFLNFNDEKRITLEKSDLIQLVDYCLQKGAETRAQIPEHLNIKQLSKYVSYSEPAIYKMVAQAVIPSYKISGKLLFKKTEIDDWLMQFQQPTIKARIAELNSKCK
jgi:excisionase family DNA binding protein